MHDQPQIFVPVNLLHSLPGKHSIGLVCPLIEDKSLSLCQIDCQASVCTEGMQSMELGLEATFRLGQGPGRQQRAAAESPALIGMARQQLHADPIPDLSDSFQVHQGTGQRGED